ncbi:MAG TPA: biopolymer transporter ExbD [Gammaproteobacteria bacterium]|nr:biopolymer transporter ExbD [Gammaproteobacteria bacterium]
MNFIGNATDDNIDINVTSLIDVVLLLLIFFMVSTTFLNPNRINLTLPKASDNNAEQEKPHAIEVSVDKEGHYAINGQILVNSQPETLKRALSEAAKDLKEPPVIVQADAQATHQSVIRVLDVAGQLGLVHISFATETPPDQSEP